MAVFDRHDFKAEYDSKIDLIRNECPDIEDKDPDDKAYCYLIADIFETLDDGKFFYTDGANDLGIDFYVNNENSYRIFQCKSADLAKYPDGKVFDSTPVNELDEAISYLLGENRNGNSGVTSLRNQYQLDTENNSLTATLAILGTLSESARDRFDALKKKYATEGVAVRLIDERDLFDTWHAFESGYLPKDVTLKLTAQSDAILKQTDWFCAILDMKPLMDAVHKYGTALFDLNVRAKLRKSNVNQEITRTISTPKGQKSFIHLNNGIVITCANYKYSDKKSDAKGEPVSITLNGAQIINGCQTLSTIWDYYLNANAAEKEDLCRNTKIFAKVIRADKKDSGDLLEQIIIASNNQNPMNARNLKSNTAEQKQIQQSLADVLPAELRYFYIRKDGELEAFLNGEAAQKQPKKRLFTIKDSKRKGINRLRHVDNEQLAKIWWAWIGNSSAVNKGGIKYFEGPIYRNIFERRPSDQHWAEEAEVDFGFSDKLLESPHPSQYQLLTALAVGTYIQERIRLKPSKKAYKQQVIEKYVAKGSLKQGASTSECDAALGNDLNYLSAVWLSQMGPILTELAAYALLQKYGTLDSEVCKALLEQTDVKLWLERGLDGAALESPVFQEDGLLSCLYEWINYAVRSYFTFYKRSLMVATRPKLLLGTHENIVEMKKSCYEAIEDTRESLKFKHKKEDETFLDALPSL